MAKLEGHPHPKHRRVRSRSEFLTAQKSGVRVHTAHFVLLLALGPAIGAPARLGITVTRKVGDSVRRNRIRRVVREAFRLDPSLLPDGIDLIVIAKTGAPSLSLAGVQDEWSRIRGVLQKQAQRLVRSALRSVATETNGGR